jgi:hypothetical protein
MSEIYVRAREQVFGPYDEKEFLSLLGDGKIPFAAWIFGAEKGSKRWLMLAEVAELRKRHPEFESEPEDEPVKSKASKVLRLTKESAASTATVSAEPIWFVIRDKKKFGPFSAADIVAQLQRKQLDGTAYVWRPGFSTWQKMSQVEEFSRDSMKRLATDTTPLDILVKRKFARTPYEVDVIAHDNTKAVEGKTMVIGEGGLFLATSRPTHQVGARLKLHFREGGTEPFNAVAEVVSIVKGASAGYCLRFVAISDSDRRRIAKLVAESKNAR